MSTNMELITSVTVGSGGTALVTLPVTGTIPQTYTDLKIVISARTNRSNAVDAIGIYFNNDTTSARYSAKQLTGTGSGTQRTANNPFNDENMYVSGDSATASTFGNSEIYIPNYTGSNQKSFSVDSVSENNGTTAYANLSAGLYNQTTAITTIRFVPISGTSIQEGSTFYLYGISSVTSTPKATGGIVSQDATHWYHTFPFTSTFTPTAAISADILCVAGGGGSGYDLGGGGGAGGLLTFTSQSLTTTGYTVTVGAGGSAGLSAGNGGNGGNSQFGSLTASVGGGGGMGDTNSSGGSSGGSGGGASSGNGRVGGAGQAGQGFAGANAQASGSYIQAAAGGGGAGAVGTTHSNPSSPVGGNGGIGATSSLINAMGLATFTGQIVGSNVYFAGGGAGGTNASGTPGTGGLGGGANGARGSSSPSNIGNPATINTGGGGGGGGINSANGAPGGSGLVIVRYAK